MSLPANMCCAGHLGSAANVGDRMKAELMKKRKKGKLPPQATEALKAWWEQNSHWPYPSVSGSAHAPCSGGRCPCLRVQVTCHTESRQLVRKACVLQGQFRGVMTVWCRFAGVGQEAPGGGHGAGHQPAQQLVHQPAQAPLEHKEPAGPLAGVLWLQHARCLWVCPGRTVWHGGAMRAAAIAVELDYLHPHLRSEAKATLLGNDTAM